MISFILAASFLFGTPHHQVVKQPCINASAFHRKGVAVGITGGDVHLGGVCTTK